MNRKLVIGIPIASFVATFGISMVAGLLGDQLPIPLLAIVWIIVPGTIAATHLLRFVRSKTPVSMPLVFFLMVNLLTMMNLSQDESLSVATSASMTALARLGLRLVVNGVILAWFALNDFTVPANTRPWVLSLSTFALLTAMSIPLSEQRLYSFGRWLDLFLFLFASMMILTHMELSPHSILLSGFTSLFLLIAALWAWWLVDPIPMSRAVFLEGPGGDVTQASRFGGYVLPPNACGFTGATLVLLALYALRTSAGMGRSLPVLAGLLGVLTVQRSGARTALVALFVALLWIIASQLGGKEGRYSALSFIFLGSTGFVIWLLAGASTSLLSRSEADTTVWTLTGRTDLWRNVINSFAEHESWWLFGTGFNTLSSTFRMGGLITESAHNGYLQILVGTGILGLATFLGILATSLIGVLTMPDLLMRSTLISLYIVLILHNFAEIGAFVMVNPATLLGVVVALAAVRSNPSALKVDDIDSPHPATNRNTIIWRDGIEAPR